jgi:hypothetical protein
MVKATGTTRFLEPHREVSIPVGANVISSNDIENFEAFLFIHA